MSRIASYLLPLVIVVCCGCADSKKTPPPEQPRPVKIMTLRGPSASSGQLRTASVGSWKTEKLGFEVAGRVRWVLEPGTEIRERILTGDQQIQSPGTALGQLDTDRYQLAVDSAKAKVDSALRKKESAEVDLKNGIPARINSAKANIKLATSQYNRTVNLARRGGNATQEDVDKAQATLETAKAELEAEQAALKGKAADVRSLEADHQQAEQALKEAERNLRDTTLYSGFRGQVAEVHVVPGSFVTQGQAAMTVQMMNPIKIELQVSAADSRRLSLGSQVRFYLTENGKRAPRIASVYMVDAVADSRTRTFTVTLLTRNERKGLPIPASLKGKPVARTEMVIPARLDFLPGGDKSLMVEQQSIHKDEKGHFIWKVNNRKQGTLNPNADPILQVSKIRVTPGTARIPFLGKLTFMPVSLADGAKFDPSMDLVVGKITVSEGEPDKWNGDKILLDRPQWQMRPGDVVQVNLFGKGEVKSGFSVPMGAITKEQGKSYVFIARGKGTERTVKKVEVKLLNDSESTGVSNQVQLEAVDGESLKPGVDVVLEGAHYLRDGEKARVISQGSRAR